MEPLVKWPGGKRAELAIITPLIPAHGRLVEPFAGGAALYFAQQPSVGLLNDRDEMLTGLYMAVAAGEQEFVDALYELIDTWEAARANALDQSPIIARGHAMGELDTKALASRWAQSMARDVRRDLAREPSLPVAAARSLADKSVRLRRLAEKAPISDEDLQTQLATGLLAGLYTFLRDIYEPPSRGHRLVVWWFLREMCYGSMFRFNRRGRFNIPYGGASYNRKNLRAKADLLSGSAARELLATALITNLDFPRFFSAYDDRADDFIFLDPPYDSEFSDYGNHAFGPAEQRVLCHIIADLDAQLMLIVKNTELMRELYFDIAANNPRFTVGGYSQKYGYNMRGRNERAVEHLLITNYSLPGA